jgi:hypothetical protein
MHETYFSILGYTYAPYDGGYCWHSEAPIQEVIDAVEGFPCEEETFLRMDLETDSAAQILAARVIPDRFTALKVFQCGLIRSRRAAAYRNEADGLFFGYQADADSSDTWLNKRIEIKSRYPWPGSYR